MSSKEEDFIYQGSGEVHFSNPGAEILYVRGLLQAAEERCAELEAEIDSALTELEQYGEAYANVDPAKPGQTTESNMLCLIKENEALKAAARALLDKANEYNEQDRMGLLVVQLEALEELL